MQIIIKILARGLDRRLIETKKFNQTQADSSHLYTQKSNDQNAIQICSTSNDANIRSATINLGIAHGIKNFN